jgi:tight adherence protein C
MSRLTILIALSGGMAVTATLWALLKPPRWLGGRVRPYAQVARSRLLRGGDPNTYRAVTRPAVTIRDALQPAVERVTQLHARLLGPHDEEALAIRLRQAGLYPGLEADQRLAAHRFRSLMTSLFAGGALGFVGWSTGGPITLALYATGGLVLGAALARGRVDRAINRRRQRMIAELYSINQILAMRARAGGGVVDALSHVAQRSTGAITAEIRETLTLHRSGIPITAALRRAASSAPEPEAARLYQSLAVAQERGVDLADSLLALARDLRTDRRDRAVTRAATRRIAAVVPIVVILAPIAIAFLAAPLPTLIFGSPSP